MSEIITHEGDTIITLVPPRWLDPALIPGGGGGGVSPKFGVFALCCRTVTETQGSTCKCEKVDVMPYYQDTNSVDTFSAAGKVVLGVEKVTFFGTFWVKQLSNIFDSFFDAWNFYIANGPAAVWKQRGDQECCPQAFCYRVSGSGPSGASDCCGDGGCCNYDGVAINELLTGGPPTWTAYNCGPVGTSNWSLARDGEAPNYTWTLYNDCQAGCHPGMYIGTATWNGEGSKSFSMGSYPAITVTKEACP